MEDHKTPGILHPGFSEMALNAHSTEMETKIEMIHCMWGLYTKHHKNDSHQILIQRTSLSLKRFMKHT